MECQESTDACCNGFNHFTDVIGLYKSSSKSYICFEHNKYMDETDLWIKEQERFIYADNNYQREPLEYLNIYFCFVDTDNSIVKVDTEKYLFSDTDALPTRIIGESAIVSYWIGFHRYAQLCQM